MTTTDQFRLEAANPWLNPESAAPVPAAPGAPAATAVRIEVYRLPDVLPETFSLLECLTNLFRR
jgi:hypothetical protein